MNDAQEKLKIFIGTEPNQYVPQQVLIYSIKEKLSRPADIRPTRQKDGRVGGTNFGFVRFNVPQLANYNGKAVYMDADQIVLDDMAKLFDALDDSHDIALVQNAQGSYNKKELTRANQTSVMVLNCDRLKDWNPKTMFDGVVANREEPKAGQIRYKNFMQLEHLDQSRIQELDPAWNHYNQEFPNSKLIHFSHVRSQPWKNPAHALTPMWTQWLKRAMKAGYLSRARLLWEIIRGHVHTSFLPLVWGK